MVAQGSGSIISTSSTAGVLGGLGPHVYTAAKHGVIGLTKSAANELGPRGIRVNAISPGGTATPMIAGLVLGDHTDTAGVVDRLTSLSFLGYPTLPVDVANAAVYLASDESRCVTGHTLVVDEGSTTAGTTLNPFHVGAGEVVAEAGRRDPG
jgi:NAD(P)-dependent dehydrogenase (short-subunit alcohol dehydrogenase family)